MFGIGPTELVVILVVALLVLGPKRLPEIARALGRGLAEFRKATADVTSELDEARIALEREAREASRRAEPRDTAKEAAGKGPGDRPRTYSRTASATEPKSSGDAEATPEAAPGETPRPRTND
jgi:TatA/E family protein of Tat protein translocase